ncbi:type II toxin-antitoxin system VapC family toxin [Sulfuracidifex metallicus]|uniref:PIN domain-containing protein n=1 Tax=Sulfuracidifex metallicus DSM 6482 = JCM 9184 TaxID=523847 RepID=A0A6A9QP26_SULME|nr:type II toxin-antitoxin system VapC family toxin [Sulfuracidifex metallicus]MUN28941.1 PIN domain-containing protein [Sulfuracidifex metallicus DSM 6482 = JCM 9184]WOE50552.1 type II toxin-antitoxin system VapC family toxin [Sulfuracidifex metallicus DSM 6482 = JCM 9184]
MIFLDANFLVYLNLNVDEIRDYYLELLDQESLFLDPLVMDEVIYVSRKKYSVNFVDTINFLDELVSPYVVLLSITAKEYEKAKEVMLKYGLKPSDAFHVAVMLNNSILTVLSEDSDFDKVSEIKRVWLKVKGE